MAAGRHEREQASDHVFPADPWPQQRERPQEQEDGPLHDRNGGSFEDEDEDGASGRNRTRSAGAGIRGYAAGEEEEEGDAASNHRSWVDNIGVGNAAGRMDTLRQHEQREHQRKLDALQGSLEPAAAAAGKLNSFPVNMGDIMSHVAAKDARAYGGTAGRSVGGMPAGYPRNERAQGGDGDGVDDQGRSPATRALASDSGIGRVGAEEEEPPDQAYIHSLGYGNLGSVLPILLDRRSALEVWWGSTLL